MDAAAFTRTCIVIQMNSAYDIILGMPFLTEVNPIIDWKLKHWKTLDMTFPIVCDDKPRDISLNIISANAMARSIRKNTDPSTKYFLAFFKQEYDYVQLSAVQEKENGPENIAAAIRNIKTDFFDEFTEKNSINLYQIQYHTGVTQ